MRLLRKTQSKPLRYWELYSLVEIMEEAISNWRVFRTTLWTFILPRIVKAGYRVAICEQLEKPSKEKKIVKRGVTEMVTPGLGQSMKSSSIIGKTTSLAAIHFTSRGHFGLAFLDVSTGEFLVSEGNQEAMEKLMQSFRPSEVIFSNSNKNAFERIFGNEFFTFNLPEWVFMLDYCREKLIEHFQVKSLKGFSIQELEAGQIAAGAWFAIS